MHSTKQIIQAASRTVILVAGLLAGSQFHAFGQKAAEPLVIPQAAVWRCQTSDRTHPQKAVTVVAVVDGEKWRSESTSLGHKVTMVYNGTSFVCSIPGAPQTIKADFDPKRVLHQLQKDLSHPTKKEAFQSGGRKLVRYELKDEFSDTTVVLDAVTRFPVSVVGRTSTANPETTFELIAYNVKAHAAELFDVANLGQMFDTYLVLPPVAQDGGAAAPPAPPAPQTPPVEGSKP